MLSFLFVFVSCVDQKRDTQEAGEEERAFNATYRGEFLNRIAYPLGGIGAGMVCIEGTGAFSHVSVRHRADIFNEPLMFAALSVRGMENGAKILEGPVPKWKYFGRPGSARGGERSSYGLPRFQEAAFTARFPFAEISLSDKDIPLEVTITGWSPFIPGDPDNSGLPVGVAEYHFKNSVSSGVDIVFSFHSVNLMKHGNGKNSILALKNGFILSQEAGENAPRDRGDFAIFTDKPETVVDHCWFRGGWWDPLTMTWKNVEKCRVDPVPPASDNAPGASLYVPLTLAPGEEKVIRLMFSWYVPDTDLRLGKDPEGTGLTENAKGCCASPFYEPWYSGKFSNVQEVAAYWNTHYGKLKDLSQKFTDAFYSSTLPPEVLEAIAANLTILKSPTVLRQRDGRLWAWEGCNDNSGCCEGSCTHVWNYAQAIPHLFPSLERTLRETEFMVSQDSSGHQAFRSALPIRPRVHDFYAAADGQLGGIMKVYRDWRISGSSEWMKVLYPRVKASMDYCIDTWDPRHRGIPEEPHHNTYDIEFWGPDGMCASFYIGALTAFTGLGEYLGEDVSDYRILLERGKTYMRDSLFNGEYFFQRIRWKGLNAPDPVELSRSSWTSDYSDEARLLLEKEGPKYQYGEGCLSDGVLGFWLARMCGLENPLNPGLIASHLQSVYRYNLRHDFSDHANPQRPTFALGNEGGLLLCTWPKGGELSLPFVYSNEVWTGIEYQVASHLMLMNETDKGLDIVRTCRKRYDGRIRNPFNEYECGHWYARAMSSYGLIMGLTGVRYDAVDRILYIGSDKSDFSTFFSGEPGFGNVGIKKGKPFVNMMKGSLDVKKVIVNGTEMKLN